MSHKIYHILARGFVEERGMLGKMIVELAATEKQSIQFYTHTPEMMGGSTEIFLQCSEAFANKIGRNPHCQSIAKVDPAIALRPAPEIHTAFKTFTSKPRICFPPKPTR